MSDTYEARRRDDIILEYIKDEKSNTKELLKEYDNKWIEIQTTLHNIDKFMLKHALQENERKKLLDSNELRFKKIENDIEVFRDDYIGKKSITKLLGGFALFAGLCISGLMYQIEHSNQLLEAEAKRTEQREAYARTIPSPEQEAKIKKLEDALLNSKASLTSR